MADGYAPSLSRRKRFAIAAGIIVFQILLVMGLVRAFAPDFSRTVAREVMSVFAVTVTVPEPEPEAQPKPETDEGAAGERGKKAKPREVSAPRKTLPKKPEPVPPASSTGRENRSGSSEAGTGTGGANSGTGTGSGNSGSGQGSGAVTKLEKIKGDINSARDYPRETRDLRIGHSVTILLTVGTNGRVTDCRVTQPSPDPQSDAITCQLATKRFRFRPATDDQGNPVVGKYAWRQRWFY